MPAVVQVRPIVARARRWRTPGLPRV
jgi:hypothetical protein